MGAMASHITSLTIVFSTVYSGAGQRKHQSSTSLAFVWGIHRWPVNSPHKWPVTRKVFPFDDVIMITHPIYHFDMNHFLTLYNNRAYLDLIVCVWMCVCVCVRAWMCMCPRHVKQSVIEVINILSADPMYIQFIPCLYITLQSLHCACTGSTAHTSWFFRQTAQSAKSSISIKLLSTLQWRHNGLDGVLNQQPHDCLLNCLVRRRSEETSKFRVTGLCVGNSPVTDEFPAQMASNASLWSHP